MAVCVLRLYVESLVEERDVHERQRTINEALVLAQASQDGAEKPVLLLHHANQFGVAPPAAEALGVLLTPGSP